MTDANAMGVFIVIVGLGALFVAFIIIGIIGVAETDLTDNFRPYEREEEEPLWEKQKREREERWLLEANAARRASARRTIGIGR